MEIIRTDWFPADVTPLAERAGEYETFVGELVALRWWNGQAWSEPYFETDPLAVIELARGTVSGYRGEWRGAAHRFTQDDSVRTGAGEVATIAGMRRSELGWHYLLTGSGATDAWLPEEDLTPVLTRSPTLW